MSSSDPIPSSREVYDPSIGADGGQGDALASIDPTNPVDHVDQLGSAERPVGFERATGVERAAPSSGLVACPTCGTGVDPARIRS